VPLYEYQCKSCHSTTERIQKFSDPPLTVCPHCGGELEQLLSAPAVQFKGAGWYVTDYGSKGKSGSKEEGTSGSSDSSAAKKDSAGGEQKTESKDSRKKSTKDTKEKK